MCERLRTHVFLAPSSISVPDKDSFNTSSSVSAAWDKVDLSWKDGRLQLIDQLAAANKTTLIHNPLPVADGSQNPNTFTEKECSASILEYLESCFPLSEQDCLKVPTTLSHKSQYISTLTLSQALILKRSPLVSATRNVQTSCRTSPPGSATSSSTTPELFSPNHNSSPATNSPAVHLKTLRTSSPTHSAELFSGLSSSSEDEEGCVLLQATAGGLLCSQGQELDERPSKKTKFSEDFVAKTSVADACPVEADLTTPLACCVKAGTHYSILVAVVHPCHLKEIKLKSGACIPLASIVVTDQSAVEMKVALWRRAAFWVLTVNPGDVLLITELQLNEDTWRGESVLRSTYNSKLLNLGRVPPSGSLTDSQQVRAQSLSPLYDFLTKHRPLLVSLPILPAQTLNNLPYATIRSLRPNTLVHMLLQVTHTHLSKEWQSEADSRCRSALQRRAVVRVEQPGGQQGALVLWGAAVEWLSRFARDKATVWDFRNLLVKEGMIFNITELHSTSWSTMRALNRTDSRVNSFMQPLRAAASSSSSVELDLKTLLSQKYSGEVELRIHVEAFHFCAAPLSPNPPLILDRSSSAADVLKLLSSDVTFTGCGRCGAELDTDSNGIYCPCYPCLPNTSVRCYFRPAVLTLTDRDHQMCVQVPPILLQKILTAPPDKLSRSSAPGSEVKNIEVAAQRLHNLLSLPKKDFTVQVQTHFLCDENSVPLCQEFTLLDFQFPP
ncbi:shieldin complex subunit 2 [Eucyclogobius newberryi]|uniref:shieldin complex subunit 2 n=1 Tax=Eucyclogobius newberryi TaxID=166745 RepID=UPI003B5AF490